METEKEQKEQKEQVEQQEKKEQKEHKKSDKQKPKKEQKPKQEKKQEEEQKKEQKKEQKRVAPEPRLKLLYKNEIIPAMMKKFQYKNVMQVPRLLKIVVNMGVGEAARDIKELDHAMEELGLISGQKPKLSRAKKSISAFKVRSGMPVGCFVSLRGKRMYEFLDRLINIAIPRIRDFRGLPTKSFDGRGNHSFGIKEHLIFVELDYNKVPKVRGMNITTASNARNDEECRELLKLFGMPFRREEEKTVVQVN